MNVRPVSVRHIIEDLDRRDALELARAVARAHAVTLEDLVGRSRRAPAAAARHELWVRLYDEAIPTFSALARVFGRDHSTIAVAVRRYAAKAEPAGVSTSSPVDLDERSDAACRPTP